MPQRHHDPFASRARELNASVNPYVATMVAAAESGDLPILFGENLRGAAGHWRERIANYYAPEAGNDTVRALPQRLVVEIGCHKGQTLIEMAQEHPNDAFIGIDITFKRVVSTAQRAKAAKLSNVFCVLANAVSLHLLFAAGEVDGAVIFFPDPWVRKKRQAKNRLVDAAFCTRLGDILAPQGFCWFKTDQQLYFNEATAHFHEAGFTPAAEIAGLLERDYSSTFEKRFREQNLPTFGAKWGKPVSTQLVASE